MSDFDSRAIRVDIRHATPADAGAVAACLSAAFAPYRSRYSAAGFADTVLTAAATERRMEQMTILVAQDENGIILGTIAHEVLPSGDGHLRGMAVEPQLQGRGVALQLLAAAEGELLAAGCARVTLDTTEPLQRAIRFYERCGYRATAVVKDFFGMPLFEYAKLLALPDTDS